MKSVLILGSGRSGTSMIAGCLAGAGYFMGENLLVANEGNPKGFFEDVEVNSINEDLLESVSPRRLGGLFAPFTRRRPERFQRWLLNLPRRARVRTSPELSERIARLVARQPFCYKDPRFAWTLPAWRPFLRDPLFVVVFRSPPATAKSIVVECERDQRLRDLAMTERRALRIWASAYARILGESERGGDWLFLHYDDVLEGAGLDVLAERAGAELDRSFPTRELRRSVSNDPTPFRAARIYGRLCARARQDASRRITGSLSGAERASS